MEVKRVIVVGGSSGIGAAIVEVVRKKDHKVLTLQRSDTKDPPCLFFDLRWPQEEIKKRIDSAIVILGGLDWLVLSGGVGAYTNPRVNADDLTEILDTNFLGPVYTFDACLKHLRRAVEQPTSRVLVIGSTVHRHATNGLEHYAASRAASECWFRFAGKRFARMGVRINVLEPGWIESPMTREIKPEFKEKIIKAIPLKRFGQVGEAAQAALAILEGPDYFVNTIQMSGGL